MSNSPIRLMPAISVITTVYNDEAFIASCVQSVLGQSCEDYEMIVVDDGSTDGTSRVLAGINHPRLCVFHEDRIGRAKALNLAVSHAFGRYLAILDSDDVMSQGRLEQHLSFLDKHSDVTFVANRLQVRIDNRGAEIDRTELQDENGAYYTALLQKASAPYCHSSVTLRADTLRSIGGFDERLTCLLDLDMYVRMAAHGPPAMLPGEGSRKRIHAKQYFRYQMPARHIHHLRACTIVRYRAAAYLGGSYLGILAPALTMASGPFRAVLRRSKSLCAFREKWKEHLHRRMKRRLQHHSQHGESVLETR